MEKILKTLSYALVALWVVVSSVSAHAVAQEFPQEQSSVAMLSTSDGASGTNMSMSCEKHHMKMEKASHLFMDADTSECADHSSLADCKMHGSDHCSSTLSKNIVAEYRLAATHLSDADVLNSHQHLSGISIEALTPPPRL